MNNENAYSVYKTGEFKEIVKTSYTPSPNFSLEGKVFLKEKLDLKSCEISLNTMAVGAEIPFLHKHKENEEIYIGICGEGQLLLNDEVIEIAEGTTVRVSKDTERAIRNIGDVQFSFIVVQAKENSELRGTTSDGYAIEKKPNWKNH